MSRTDKVQVDRAAVKRARLARGWTQADVAGRAGLSKMTISRVESRGAIGLSSATAIARVLRVPVKTLLIDVAPAESGAEAGDVARGATTLVVAALGVIDGQKV